MAYQKGFYGVSYAQKDAGASSLIKSLSSLQKGLETYGAAAGAKLDEKVKAEAETAARIDGLKSYQQAVDSGKIDATKSEFFIAAYDNVKGKSAGIDYAQKKMLAYQEWWAQQTNADIDDVDGSGYMAWSQEYDTNALEANNAETNFFMKGFDPYISQANQQLSAKYASANSNRLKEKGKLNFSLILEDGLLKNGTSPEAQKALIKQAEQQAELMRFIPKDEINSVIIQSYKNAIGVLADKNSINADYDTALVLAKSLKDYTRENGSKVLSGVEAEKYDKFYDQLIDEKNTYEKNLIKRTQSEAVASYVEQQITATKGKFYNSVYNTDVMTDGKELWGELLPEFRSRYKEFLIANPDASFESKKDVARTMLLDLNYKYQNVQVDGGSGLQLMMWQKDQQFNVRGRMNILNRQVKKIAIEKSTNIEEQTKTLPMNTVITQEEIFAKTRSNELWSLMRLSGYLKNEDGSKKEKVTLGDVKQFMDDYMAWERSLGAK